MNNIIIEIKKITLEGINSRITEAEEWITVLGNRMAEIPAIEQNKEKKKNVRKRGQSPRPLGQH